MFNGVTFFSTSFHVSNGVRQGGILSPYLFNLYINELCYKLSSYNAGCNFNSEMINNIAYADDMSLLSSSPKGLQKAINICEEYGKKYDIIFNPKKSMCMWCVLQEKLWKLITHQLLQ